MLPPRDLGPFSLLTVMATEENAIRIAEYSRAKGAKRERDIDVDVDGIKPPTQIFVSLID